MQTASRYETFAALEARGQSPLYEALAMGVANDPELLAIIELLPSDKRQPNLLFACTRFLSGPVVSYGAFRSWVLAHWQALSTLMLSKATQTNEPGRMATLLPVLARLPGPLALLEVGASAGLCLYPDRWQYEYGDERVGDPQAPYLRCQPIGPFVAPAALPDIAWRAGLDLNPLRVHEPADVRWLEALIWPDQPERLHRLRTAIELARVDPPHLSRGDLVTDLHAAAEQAPSSANLVVLHSAVLTYVDEGKRATFVERVSALPGHWISNEGVHVLDSIVACLPSACTPDDSRFLAALDGKPVAWSGPHGQSFEWLTPQPSDPPA